MTAAGGTTYTVRRTTPGAQCDWCGESAAVIVHRHPDSGGDWLCWWHFDRFYPDLATPA